MIQSVSIRATAGASMRETRAADLANHAAKRALDLVGQTVALAEDDDERSLICMLAAAGLAASAAHYVVDHETGEGRDMTVDHACELVAAFILDRIVGGRAH